MLILLLKSVEFEWDNKMLVSSANKIGTDLSFADLTNVVYKHEEKQRSQNRTLEDTVFNFSPS